jgi:hypothetical protein
MRVCEEAQLVAEQRSNFASISIYRRLKLRVLSRNAAIQSALADFHDDEGPAHVIALGVA